MRDSKGQNSKFRIQVHTLLSLTFARLNFRDFKIFVKLNSREKKLRTRDFSGTLHGAKRERPNLFKGRRPYRLKIRLKTLRRYFLLLVSPSVYFYKDVCC